MNDYERYHELEETIADVEVQLQIAEADAETYREDLDALGEEYDELERRLVWPEPEEGDDGD